MILVKFLPNVTSNWSLGVSCRVWCSVVSYSYVSFSGLITSVKEERTNYSAIFYS